MSFPFHPHLHICKLPAISSPLFFLLTATKKGSPALCSIADNSSPRARKKESLQGTGFACLESGREKNRERENKTANLLTQMTIRLFFGVRVAIERMSSRYILVASGVHVREAGVGAMGRDGSLSNRERKIKCNIHEV